MQEAPTSNSPPPADSVNAEPQWLWTFDAIQLRRDEETGETIFIDEATGQRLPERPSIVPPEAYSNRFRRHPHPDWDVPKQEPSDNTSKSRGSSRHVFLIRHSQYNLDGKTDAQRVLTPLGERQAMLLGTRLAAIHAATSGTYCSFSLATLKSSALTRAIQTADLLAPWLPDAQRTSDPTLNEGRPCLPEPAPRHRASYNNKNGDGERIERAYRKICARPDANQKADTHEVIVCHANVIRYVVCRALQVGVLRPRLPNPSATRASTPAYVPSDLPALLVSLPRFRQRRGCECHCHTLRSRIWSYGVTAGNR